MKHIHHSRFSTIAALFAIAGLLSFIIFVSCSSRARGANDAVSEAIGPATALVNLRLIDGVSDAPIGNAAIVIRGKTIVASGKAPKVAIPADATVIDLGGATVMPGFINAHVHHGYVEENLRSWARAGVTTVRDLANLEGDWREGISWRDARRDNPEFARLLVVGPGLKVPNGYGTWAVSSMEETERVVNELADRGVDAIKLTFEDGYGGRTRQPKMTEEEYRAAVRVAHKRGLKVVGHVTSSDNLALLVRMGVDQAGHMPYETVPKELMKKVIAKKIPIMTTITVFDGYGVASGAKDNLARFHKEGGAVIALGDDFGGGAGRFDHMPLRELQWMKGAGMSGMEVIKSATSVAAEVCGVSALVGRIKPGLRADILAVRGDPLADLKAISNVRLVMRDGVVINDGAER